jgi:hypothetical protein
MNIFKRSFPIALFLLVVVVGMSFAAYNPEWVKTQALYLNDVLVTSTAAEINFVDNQIASAVPVLLQLLSVV